MPSPRDQAVQRNLAQALEAAGVDFAAQAEWRPDGHYTVTFAKPGRILSRSGIPSEVLEHQPSPRLVALIEEIRQAMSETRG